MFSSPANVFVTEVWQITPLFLQKPQLWRKQPILKIPESSSKTIFKYQGIHLGREVVFAVRGLQILRSLRSLWSQNWVGIHILAICCSDLKINHFRKFLEEPNILPQFNFAMDVPVIKYADLQQLVFKNSDRWTNLRGLTGVRMGQNAESTSIFTLCFRLSFCSTCCWRTSSSVTVQRGFSDC